MALLTLLFPRLTFAGTRRGAVFWLATLTISTLLASKSWAQTEFNEYQLKAVFLFNFAQFVEWPGDAFTNEKSPLTIAVIGDDSFAGLLGEVVRGEHVGPREIKVRRLKKIEEGEGCQIMFISKSESAVLESMIAALDGRAVLTVSDADRAARRGTMIRFVTEKKKIHLRINLDAVKRANLVVSSKLLRVAEIVTTGKEQP